jgi:cytidine deaminase
MSQRHLPSDEKLRELAAAAWAVRERAHIIGPTKVGCTILTETGHIYAGCNIEHRYRCHDVHAEITAIAGMVAAEGGAKIKAVFVAAAREKFTPCGGCIDWIMQFAGEPCMVYSQSSPEGEIKGYTTVELMPHYPR